MKVYGTETWEKERGFCVIDVRPYSQYKQQGRVFRELLLLSTLSKQDGVATSRAQAGALQNRTVELVCFDIFKTTQMTLGLLTSAFPPP